MIKMILVLACTIKFRLECMDSKGAYLQSRSIDRDMYIRPPKELDLSRKILWKLQRMLYGKTEAKRQCAEVIEGWMVHEARFERIRGVDQLYVSRDHTGKLILLAAKVTDDIFIAGSITEMNRFSEQISLKYKVRKNHWWQDNIQWMLRIPKRYR